MQIRQGLDIVSILVCPMSVSDRIGEFLATNEQQEIYFADTDAPMYPDPSSWDFVITNISHQMARALASELDLNIDYLAPRVSLEREIGSGFAIKDGAICYIVSFCPDEIKKITFNELLHALDQIEVRKSNAN